MTFGERVKQARLAKGLTQEDLTHLSTYSSRAAITAIESQGRCNAAAEKNLNLCRALGITPNELLGWKEGEML